MDYIVFSLLFTLIHTAAYVIAGVVALKISPDLYREKDRLLDYLRNMSDEQESGHVLRWFLPAQILRGFLMSVVLYPLTGSLGELSYTLRFIFLAGLMFVYTDFACAVPFNNNIEGFVYMKPRYLKTGTFWKLYLETIIYSLAFGSVAAAILF